MFDLAKLPAYYLEKYGREKVAEVTGKTPAVIAMWSKGENFTVPALQALLEFDPAPLGEIKPLYPTTTIGTKLAILMPCSGKPEPETLETLLRLYNPTEMQFKRVNFNSLPVARNALFAWWLRTEIPWAFLADSDSVFPCGDAALFKELCDAPKFPDVFAGLHTIYRLMAHGQKLVSVCYIGRKRGASPQFAGGDAPAMRDKIRRGPRDELIKVDACGFGGMLIHRSVLTDLIEQQGTELRHNSPYLKQRFGYDFSFCDPTTKETPGDDFPLAARMKRAGHQIYVDLAVMAGHVGTKVYSFSDI